MIAGLDRKVCLRHWPKMLSGMWDKVRSLEVCWGVNGFKMLYVISVHSQWQYVSTEFHVKNSFILPTRKQMRKTYLLIAVVAHHIVLDCGRQERRCASSVSFHCCYFGFFSLRPLCTSGICTLPCFCALCVLSEVSNKLLSVFLPSPPSHCCVPRVGFQLSAIYFNWYSVLIALNAFKHFRPQNWHPYYFPSQWILSWW